MKMLSSTFRFLSFAVAAALLTIASSARAQIGGTTDIITGAITGPQGVPLIGARVQVTSVETGITRSKTTNDKGEFTLLFPDGGGQYTVVARYIGMAPQQVSVSRLADEDRLIANFRLNAQPVQLQSVTVQATQRRPRTGEDERPTPGSSGRVMSADQLSRLPIDPSDPAAIALLSPGVVGISASDTSAAGFSVAGQSPDQNRVTLDGLGFEAGTVPQEAVRNTRVVTNTYDVARGQFTGGLVQTTTRGGTNSPSGTFNYNLRDPRLQWADDEGTGGFSQSFTQHQISGGFGGPIKKDRLFVFGSGQFRHRINPLQTLTGADAITLQRLGLAADSAARFLSLLDGYGLPASVAAIPDQQLADNYTTLVRADYIASENHSLLLRANYQGSLQEAFRTRALAVPSYGGEQSGSGGGALASLSSVFGLYVNEARLSYAHDYRDGDAYLLLPEGRVRIASDLAGQGAGVTTLDFGGNPALPTQGGSSQVEFTDEVSYLGKPGHRIKLGAYAGYNSFSTATSNNSLGSFTYNSLADFAANTPVLFTRTLTPREREGASLSASAYLGDTWRKSRALQLTYGFRVEHDRYLDDPAYNPDVERLFGRRTDQLPQELRVSPRAGFSWTLGLPAQTQGQDGGPRGANAGGAQGGGRGRGPGGGGGGFGGRGAGGDFGAGGANFTVIRGGIGEFRGRTPTQLFASAIDATGLANSERQLVCIGAAVPTPDWRSYLSNPSAIPQACADGGTGSAVSRSAPGVALFSDDFGAPRAWRASLGVQRRVTTTLGLNVEGSLALGRSLTGARDLNLVSTPTFSLRDEANRPVFASRSSIVQESGQTSLLASRINPEFGQVIEAMSELKSTTAQMTVSANGIASRSLIWNLSYTLMRSRDQTAFAPGGGFGSGGAIGGRGGFGSFGFGVGSSTTGGNPNDTEWGTSDLERQHSFTGSLSWFSKPWMDVTSVVRLTSGQPYTPRVGSDINGDGSRNDRAFIFDPSTVSDPLVAQGMTNLLAKTSSSARECLQGQLGTIASRNSCRAGWTPTLDMQFNMRPDFHGTVGRRVSILLSLINPIAGVDRALHGADGLRGWGQQSRPDATLLYVRRFDAVNNRYLYTVNEQFGDTQSARTALRNPFQLGLQVRIQVGPDRQREQLMGALGRGGPGGGGRGGFDIRTMVDRVAPDPVAAILERRDSLGIDDAQVAKLQTISDSFRVSVDTLSAQLQRQIDSVSAGTDLRTIFPTLRPRLQEGRDIYLKTLDRAKEVLTPEQWQKLPEYLRSPSLQQGPGRGNRPPGGPERSPSRSP